MLLESYELLFDLFIADLITESEGEPILTGKHVMTPKGNMNGDLMLIAVLDAFLQQNLSPPIPIWG